MLRLPSARAFAFVSLLLLPGVASAQGPLTNGANHSGSIAAPGEIDEWTVAAGAGDAILVAIGESGGPDPDFVPWIRLYDPVGTLVSGSYQYGNLAAHFAVSAGLAGTYTVRVASGDSGFDGLGSYVLRLVKVPGALTVSGGDQGGPLSNGGNHSGHIDLGDLDAWTFTANQNETAVVAIGEVPVGPGVPDPGFWPWIRIYNPLGDLISGTYQYGDLAAQATFVAPLTGSYTVVVASGDSGFDATGDYVLRLAKMPGSFVDENGGALANGANHQGHIDIGDLDMWSFTANQNETAVVSIGEILVPEGETDPGFWPWIRVYNPLGAIVSGTYQYGDRAAQASFVAALTGTYTVVVASGDSGGDAVGNYFVRLARMPGEFTVPTGDQGGALSNGGNHPGRIELGDLDMWSFTANQNETAVVSVGEVPVGPGVPDPGFWPWIRIYNPLGVQIPGTYQYGDLAAQATFVAPLSGTYTVVVASGDSGLDAVGDYIIRAARMPGSYSDEDGGLMVNGANHPGHISIGDLDVWTFSAAQNDTAVVSIGEIPVGPTEPDPGFWPWIRIYNPLGAIISGTYQYGNLAAQASFVAPLTGTYTVVVASGDSGLDAVGNYSLRLARMPGGFSVSEGDQGGALTNGVNHTGRIEIGDLDMWSFSACPGASVVVTINEVPVDPGTPDPGFWPWIRLYNSAGALVSGGSQYGNTLAQISHTVSVGGPFTVVVGTADSATDATGNYTVRVQVVGSSCDPPTSLPDSYATAVNTPLTIAAPGVLANDSSNGGGTMTAQLVSTVSSGVLTLNANGSFTFTPPTGFTGSTSFAYRAVNGAGLGNVVAATIAVSGTVPTTVADSYSTPQGQALNIPAPGVLANDNSNGGSAMTAQLVSAVSNGTLALNPNGGFTFTPAAGFVGDTSFTYRAANSVGAGNTATVTLSVTALVPTTVGESYSVQQGQVLNTAAPGVLGNDNSNGGGPLSAQLVSTATNGILTLAADGSFSYAPSSGFSGADSFTYRAVNNIGAGNEATVALTVVRVTEPQPPTELYAGAIKGTTVKLRFTPPAAGPTPTGYVLKGGVRPGEVLAAIPTGSTAPIFAFDAPSGVFYVRMHTVAGGVESAASNEIRIWVNVLDRPSAPANLIGMTNGSAIALAWRNTFAGGEPGGVVLDVSGSLNASLPLGLTDSFQFNGVPGGTYTLSLRAVNGAGSSPPSNTITLTFPNPCSGPPLPPTEFLAYRIGSTIHVVWEPAATGSAPTEYTLNVSGSFFGSFVTPGRTLSGTVGPGSYTISVAAANACGTSAPTATQTIVVP